MTLYRYFIVFFIFITISTLSAINNYSGEFYIFIWFTLTSNLLLYFGFRKNAIFFDTFIGVFLWLGFWLKTTVRVIFIDSQFSEGLHDFNISGNTFDEALFVSGIAFSALIIASYMREKLFFKYPSNQEEKISGLFLFYKDHRKKVLVVYIVLFVFIAVSNFYLGIYQRGEITQTILPFGLNGVYKWLLLFGVASFAALILKYEFILQKKTTYLVPILTLIEACVTNISLLSRGMILNGSALGLGMIRFVKTNHIKTNKKFWFIVVLSFIILFLSSVALVNNLRLNNTNTNISMSINTSANGIKVLFLDRWVGIEGMLAVSSSDKKNWSLLQEALSEQYDEHKISFYDLNLINSPYLNTDMSVHHYVSLPGFIAFFYYSGSILFLFIILIILALVASFIEYLAYRLSGENLILSALIAQVIAYRYAHFGYVPTQSYLLFGSIILNLLIIYGLNKIATKYYKDKKLKNATP